MGGYTVSGMQISRKMVVICLQISNFEWVDTPKREKNGKESEL